MGEEVSIVVTAKDNFTQTMTTMRNANQRFDKDLSGLQTKLDALNRTKITLKVDTNKARNELKEAEKQFAKTGSAADKLRLEMANQNYENVNRNLKLVSSNAKQTEKDMLSLTSSVSKTENRAGSGKSSGGILNTLGSSGVAAFVGNAASQIADSYVSSAFGDSTGTVFSGALSGAGMGAALGTAIAPGIGTAIGAALGGVVGTVQGLTEVQNKKDDSFKDYYQGLFETVTEDQSNSLTGGSAIAAGREITRMSFTTLLGGESEADKFLGQVQGMAASTPFEYDDLTSMAKTLKTYFNTDEILPLLTKVGDTGAALGMSTSDMGYVAQMLGSMKNSGKATLEYLKPLMDRGIPVWDYLSNSMGKTKEEVIAMVSKGLIPGEKAATILADAMGEANEGAMGLQAKTYNGLQSTLEDAQNEIDNAMGEGYNSMRKAGMENEIDWATGEYGIEMQEAYRQLGEAKGALENLQNQMINEAMQSVMSGEITDNFADSNQLDRLKELAQEYKIAQAEIDAAIESGDDTALQEAKLARGNALAEAQAIGYNEYNASEGAQAEKESVLALAENIKNDSALDKKYWDAGYKLGQQLSEGLKSAVRNTDVSGLVQTQSDGSYYMNGTHYSANGIALRKAYGMSYVPYDDFPARLHEGERVLTASENRSYNGGVPGVTISENNFVIREEADVDKVASALAAKISMAQELAD